MKPSLIEILKDFKAKLFEYPKFVDLISQKEYAAIELYEKWLIEIEVLLKKYNKTEISIIAGFRSKIYQPKLDVEFRSSIRKKQLLIISKIMFDVQDIIHQIIRPIEGKIEESKEITKQLLIILSQSGVVKYNGTDFQGFINNIWSILSTHEQLKPSSSKLLTILNLSDILLLIAEEIDLSDFS